MERDGREREREGGGGVARVARQLGKHFSQWRSLLWLQSGTSCHRLKKTDGEHTNTLLPIVLFNTLL